MEAGADMLAEPLAAAAPSLMPAPEHRIKRLEALLGKERSEHAVLQRQFAACRSEISDLQISLWGRGDGHETLETLQHQIKELQAMIWQVSNALSHQVMDRRHSHIRCPSYVTQITKIDANVQCADTYDRKTTVTRKV